MEISEVRSIITEREVKREPSCERTKALRARLMGEKLSICPERAIHYTEAMRQTEGDVIIVRRAKALKYVLERITPIIRGGELIVGNQSKFVRGTPLFPELDSSWIKDSLKKTIEETDKNIEFGQVVGIEEESTNFKLSLTPEEHVGLKEVTDYWTGKSFACLSRNLFREETSKNGFLEAMESHMANTPFFFGGFEGRTVLDFNKVLHKGFSAIIDEIEEKLRDFREVDSHPTMKEMNSVFFWLAAKIVCQGAIRFAENYAGEAERLADGESDPARKKELLEIAETCRRVPAHPARSFREAIQAYWFTFLVGQLESGPIGNSCGRFDQYMYPFYRKDLDAGITADAEVLELLECLRVKHSEIQRAQPAVWANFTSGNLFCNMVLGGCNEKGENASNDLSLLVLESAITMQTNQPTLSVRYNNKLKEDFLLKAVELEKTGIGMPAWFSDDVAITHMCRYHGASLEDARNWAIGGCSDMVIPGKSYGEIPATMGFVNIAKFLELALNDGCDPADGTLMGLKTGAVENMEYETIVESFKEQLTNGLKLLTAYTNFAMGFHPHIIPLVYHSVLTDDCIEKGKGLDELGARYNHSFSIFISGLIHVANSLAAIKRCVFEKKLFPMQELMDAIKADFEGKEEIHSHLLESPKFGNDDDFVDSIASELYKYVADESLRIMGPLGQVLIPSAYSVTTHPLFGKFCGALPDGRKAGITLCDGAVSAFPGTDVSGATALIRSATKIDALPYKSVQLNMKLHPSALKGSNAEQAFLALIKTFFDLGGYFIQFNVVDSNMLRNAQRYPKEYPDLLVRVAGFTAYWLELSKDVQDEIIHRTEFGTMG